MRMNAVLSNPKHPEYGQFTVPLPIPHNQYNGIMEALNAMDMGDPLARDCQMDEILGEYPILKRLEGKPVNIDELDYLAKRLDSFCYAQEGAQFQGAAVSYNYSDMADLINLTFSCQQVTVITDFSDLEQVGRDHYMVLNGGCASKKELDALDGYETALLLIDEGNGVITPYGVVYDNGMRLSQLYDGRHFPQYFYEPPLLTLTVQQSKDAPKTWLYLPAPDLHIKRSLVRAGIVDPADMRLSFQGSEFPDAVDCVLDMESECLEELNKLCQAIQQLSTDEIKKLGAVVEYARPETAAQVRQLAENLEQFDYAPGVQNVEEYGRYMIQKSGRFEYDENLCDYYDYARYGLERMNAEEGQVVKSGYVSYHGVLTLEELMMAILMRRYVRGTFGDKEKGFARCIYGAEEISPQRFEQLAAWRLENFGKVTGLVEIDFDKGILSALNIMDGWQSFRLKDVSSAAYFADKSGHVNKEVRWNIFLSRLEGKQLTSHTQTPVELHGSRRLRPEEIIFSDEISELDGRLNFYMDCSFNPDEVFGTHVDSADNNNWLNIYAEYDLENSQVCDALKVILCREDGFDYEMAYQLNVEEKSAILDKMGQYCREKYGQSLLEFAAEMESEITAMETPQM